jgi:hypothetical protein
MNTMFDGIVIMVSGLLITQMPSDETVIIGFEKMEIRSAGTGRAPWARG